MELLKKRLNRFAYTAVVALITVAMCGIFKGYEKVFPASANLNSEALKTIIIDPGHGGFDGGAVAADGTQEKSINLEIALRLQKTLQSLGFQVVLTRDTDKALGSVSSTTATNKQSDLNARAAIMKQYPNAVFISIHQNKFEQSNQWGLQTFYKEGDEKAKLLGEEIQASVVTQLQPKNKRLSKPDNRKVFILKNAVIPAVIVECGFISNPDDLKSLKSESYIGKLALCISNGIINYFNVTER